MCSQLCTEVLIEDPDDAERNSGKELRLSGPWLMRRATKAEQAKGGAEVVWERIGSI